MYALPSGGLNVSGTIAKRWESMPEWTKSMWIFLRISMYQLQVMGRLLVQGGVGGPAQYLLFPSKGSSNQYLASLTSGSMEKMGMP